MYVSSAQFYDFRDLCKYLGPIIVVTSLSSFLGFLSGSSFIDQHKTARTLVGLSSGLCGVIATTLTALRNAQKFDVKAEMFRAAGGQYRILATKLEQRIRLHRHLLNEIDANMSVNLDEKKRRVEHEKSAFLKFFAESYERISTAQVRRVSWRRCARSSARIVAASTQPCAAMLRCSHPLLASPYLSRCASSVAERDEVLRAAMEAQGVGDQGYPAAEPGGPAHGQVQGRGLLPDKEREGARAIPPNQRRGALQGVSGAARGAQSARDLAF